MPKKSTFIRISKFFVYPLLLSVIGPIFLFSSCQDSPSISGQEEVDQPQKDIIKGDKEKVSQSTKEFHEETSGQKLYAPLTDEEAKYYRNFLKDPHSEIRLATASVLMSHGDRSGEPVLLELLKGEDRHFRIDAFLELAERPTKKLIPDLQNTIEKEKDTMARFVMKGALRNAQKKLEEYEKEILPENPSEH